MDIEDQRTDMDTLHSSSELQYFSLTDLVSDEYNRDSNYTIDINLVSKPKIWK